jgi:hypothetical protein
MTETSAGQYFWCLRHSQVESGDDVCPAKYRLGPYSTSGEAERALDTVQRRNDKWEAEDDRWENG